MHEDPFGTALMAAVAEPVAGRARVNTYRTRERSEAPIELAYDVFGERGMPLVLVMGIGAQRIFWDEALCEQFVAAGFQVARFDHRDIGESTRLDAPTPKPLPRIGAPARRSCRSHAPYTLSDMAADVAACSMQLGLRRAHVVGASLGGMVAQHLAIEHPTRVRSMTSIMSTPGGAPLHAEAPRVPCAVRAVAEDRRRGGRARREMFRVIGSTAWPPDGARLAQIGGWRSSAA